MSRPSRDWLLCAHRLLRQYEGLRDGRNPGRAPLAPAGVAATGIQQISTPPISNETLRIASGESPPSGWLKGNQITTSVIGRVPPFWRRSGLAG